VSAVPAQEQHRFVVVWRREPREISGAAPEWRGWVARVPDARQRNISPQQEDRVGIRSLEDAPDAMRRLIQRAAGTQEATPVAEER